MSSRTKELLAMSALGCLMFAWTVGAAIVVYSHARTGGELLMPIVVGCASFAILLVIADFIRAILRETAPPADAVGKEG